MITNEAEIRIALQAVLVAVLALTGYWGCAVVVVLILLPWKPIYAVGCYLAQPLVDWRFRKAREHQGRGIAQIERELDVLLDDANAPLAKKASKPAPVIEPKRFEPVNALDPNALTVSPLPQVPQSSDQIAATLAIPPAIQNHVRNLPQGAFHNMDLEVEQVKFHGDMADATVRFKSSNVSGLVIRQCYRLRKSGDHWEVESRQPANGSSNTPPLPHPPSPPQMRPT